MKKLVATLALIFFAGLFSDALAQGTARAHHRRAMAIKERHHPSPGRYTRTEKMRLKRQKEEIKFMKHEARRNGFVSPRERHKISRAEQKYRRMKHHAKYR